MERTPYFLQKHSKLKFIKKYLWPKKYWKPQKVLKNVENKAFCFISESGLMPLSLKNFNKVHCSLPTAKEQCRKHFPIVELQKTLYSQSVLRSRSAFECNLRHGVKSHDDSSSLSQLLSIVISASQLRTEKNGVGGARTFISSH